VSLPTTNCLPNYIELMSIHAINGASPLIDAAISHFAEKKRRRNIEH